MAETVALLHRVVVVWRGWTLCSMMMNRCWVVIYAGRSVRVMYAVRVTGDLHACVWYMHQSGWMLVCPCMWVGQQCGMPRPGLRHVRDEAGCVGVVGVPMHVLGLMRRAV